MGASLCHDAMGSRPSPKRNHRARIGNCRAALPSCDITSVSFMEIRRRHNPIDDSCTKFIDRRVLTSKSVIERVPVLNAQVENKSETIARVLRGESRLRLVAGPRAPTCRAAPARSTRHVHRPLHGGHHDSPCPRARRGIGARPAHPHYPQRRRDHGTSRPARIFSDRVCRRHHKRPPYRQVTRAALDATRRTRHAMTQDALTRQAYASLANSRCTSARPCAYTCC